MARLVRWLWLLVLLTGFYNSWVLWHAGQALLCYSVINATGVRLDPPVESVWPSMSRCFEVAPARITRYSLTAEGADHKTVSETLEVLVKP